MAASYNYTEEQLLEAIDGSNGIVANVAKALKCDWLTAKRHIQKHDIAQEAMSTESERVIDKAENVVGKALDKDDIQTAKWVLATKGKKRGYTEKHEIEHTGEGLPVSITIKGVE